MAHCAGFLVCCPLQSLRVTRGIANLIVPERNAAEAAVVEGVNVYPVRTLIQVRELLNTRQAASMPSPFG